ncbi:MAG TPA: sigma-54 dependent transcriptional regulator [Planctomycetota bacterium]|nr:sigma-54 dependent transcriptional regulator [Planctomycetota bacterium]
MRDSAKVLVVDDDMDSRTIAGELVRSVGFQARTVSHAKEALEILERERYDVVLSDIRMRESTGFDLLWVVRKRYPELPVVLMTAFPSLESAVDSVKKGACEYLHKPLQSDELFRTLKRCVTKTSNAPEPPPTHVEERTLIIGRSPAIVQVYKTIARAAPSRSPVLIEGETGTGKELVARALHQVGPRSAAPFVEVNCAAVPETLIESEFFGHMKGSFTGAHEDHAGLFEQAHGGSLFLDEIGHIPKALQAKLLKAIEDGAVRRVGGTQPVSVDVRLISATSRPIQTLIQDGLFLEELYYRLNTVMVQVPPLRERTEDIVMLARHFLRKYAPPEHYGADFAEDAVAALLAYPWPGNVRELEQVVRRAAEFTNSAFIAAHDLKLVTPGGKTPEMQKLSEVEEAHIRRVLEFTRGNKQRAADILGIDRKTLYRKLGGAGPEPEEAPLGSQG